jgi:beta-lactamase regulating signal transducer with metallopeptidase domain
VAHFLNSVFEISLVSSVVIAALLLVSPLLARKYSAKSLCIVWLALSLRLIVPLTYHLPVTLISISLPAAVQSVFEVPAYEAPTVTDIELPLDTSAVMLPTAAPSIKTTVPSNSSGIKQKIPAGRLTDTDIIAGVWALGVLSFLTIRLGGYYLLKRNIRRFSKPHASPLILEVFQKVIGQMGLTGRSVSVRVFSKISSPMLTGFARPVILLPVREYQDGGELELIFRHELVHYKRKDIWFKLLLECANAVHWFNPFVYLLTREANRQIETACDQEIVQGGDLQLRKKYGEAILASMSQDHSRQRGVPVVIAAVTVMLAASVLVACRATGSTAASASVSASATASGTVYVSASASPSASDAAEPTLTAAELVKRHALAVSWAEAVKQNDGKAQYALMTKALQDKYYDELAGLNWVTGEASLTVKDYTIQELVGGIRIIYNYSIGSHAGISISQDLTVKEEDGALKIDTLSRLQPTDHYRQMTLTLNWAEAVKQRLGKTQYAMMTKALQNKSYDELAGLNWVTGVSSPWVESYGIDERDSGIRIYYFYASSAFPGSSCTQDLTFKEEDSTLKIDSLSVLQPLTSLDTSSQSGIPTIHDLSSLLGVTKEKLLKIIPEKPVTVDEGGLGFEKTGIRVWFDTATYTKVAQIEIMSDQIDIAGFKLGDSYKDFKVRFGMPISDTNGDAHFANSNYYLSVVRDTSTDKIIAFYILADNF